jgi:hypothetical protein
MARSGVSKYGARRVPVDVVDSNAGRRVHRQQEKKSQPLPDVSHFFFTKNFVTNFYTFLFLLGSVSSTKLNGVFDDGASDKKSCRLLHLTRTENNCSKKLPA